MYSVLQHLVVGYCNNKLVLEVTVAWITMAGQLSSNIVLIYQPSADEKKALLTSLLTCFSSRRKGSNNLTPNLLRYEAVMRTFLSK